MNSLARLSLLVGLLSGSCTAYADSALGRLFYTPAERRMLDQREVAGAQDETSAPAIVTLNGRIIRSDGKTVTWANGSFAESGAQPPLARNEKLKVGQSVELNTGEVHDRLKGGRIVVRSAP